MTMFHPPRARSLRRSLRATPVYALVGLLLAITPRSHAATPAVLVGPGLDSEPVTVVGLREGELSYFDAERRLRREPVSSFVQLRGIEGGEVVGAKPQAVGGDVTDAAVPVRMGVLELVDGQRVVGSLTGPGAEADADAGEAGDAGDVLRWRHAVLGEVSVPLERVAAMTLSGDGDEPDAGGAATDRVMLVNGDAIDGFVEGVTPGAVSVIPGGIESGNAAVSLPLERVAAVRLANPADDPPAGADLVHLDDSSRVLGRKLVIQDEHLKLTPTIAPQANAAEFPDAEGRRVSLPLAGVQRIDFTGSGTRLIDLTRQPSEVAAGGEVFGTPMPPPHRCAGGCPAAARAAHAPLRPARGCHPLRRRRVARPAPRGDAGPAVARIGRAHHPQR